MSTIAFGALLLRWDVPRALMGAFATAFQYRARVLLVNTGPAKCG